MCDPVIDDEVRAAVRDFEQELKSLYGSKLRGLYLRPHEKVEGVRVADTVIVLDEPANSAEEIHRTVPAMVDVETRHDLVIKVTFVSDERWRGGGPLPGRNPTRRDLVRA